MWVPGSAYEPGVVDLEAEARDLARASPHPPIVEPTNILLPGGLVQPFKQSSPLDHNHVGETATKSG